MNWFIDVAKIGSPLAVVVAGFVYVIKLLCDFFANHAKHLENSIDKLAEAVKENTQALAKHTSYSKGKSNSKK